MFAGIEPDSPGESCLPAFGIPALPVKTHRTCCASPATSDWLWAPRRTATAGPCLELWACSVSAFFYYLIWSHKTLRTSTAILDSNSAAAEAAEANASNTKVGRFRSPPDSRKSDIEGAEVSVSVNWLTSVSCWAPQRPHFIWPIITQRSLLSKYHRCSTGGQTTPMQKKSW